MQDGLGYVNMYRKTKRRGRKRNENRINMENNFLIERTSEMVYISIILPQRASNASTVMEEVQAAGVPSAVGSFVEDFAAIAAEKSVN